MFVSCCFLHILLEFVIPPPKRSELWAILALDIRARIHTSEIVNHMGTSGILFSTYSALGITNLLTYCFRMDSIDIEKQGRLSVTVRCVMVLL